MGISALAFLGSEHMASMRGLHRHDITLTLSRGILFAFC